MLLGGSSEKRKKFRKTAKKKTGHPCLPPIESKGKKCDGWMLSEQHGRAISERDTKNSMEERATKKREGRGQLQEGEQRCLEDRGNIGGGLPGAEYIEKR